jgi:hypothetical protein
MTCCQCNELFAQAKEERVGRDKQRVGPALDRSGKRGLASDSTSSMQATNERLIRVSFPRSLFNAIITPHRGRRRTLADRALAGGVAAPTAFVLVLFPVS